MRRKPGVVPSLTRQQIVEEAFDLAREVGLDNVSIRKLASRLNKTPMALYTYFDSQQEIIDAVITAILSEIELGPIPGESWENTIRRTCRSMRAVYRKYADMNLESIIVPSWNAGKAEFHRALRAIHCQQGLPEDVLSRLWCTIHSYINGFIYEELLEEKHRRQVEQEGIDAEKAAAINYCYTEETFEIGIEVILDGIKKHAAPHSCTWETPLHDAEKPFEAVCS